MQKRSIILLCTLTLLIVSSSAMIVYAEPNEEGSLGSGYYITTNWHGVDVPPSTAVIATAKTTNPNVDTVTFTWINPAGQTVFTETVAVHFDGTYYNGKKVYSATSTYTPDALGDWTVKAEFHYVETSGHHFHCCCTSKVARRATSFNVVPEIPLIGTAGASIAMFAGLAAKMRQKPKK